MDQPRLRTDQKWPTFLVIGIYDTRYIEISLHVAERSEADRIGIFPRIAYANTKVRWWLIGIGSFYPNISASWINFIYRVPADIRIQIPITPGEADGIRGGPPPNLRVVVASPEADEFGIWIVEPAGPAEGHAGETLGNVIGGDVAVLVVVHPLDDGSVGGVYDETERTEVVGDDPIVRAVLD